MNTEITFPERPNNIGKTRTIHDPDGTVSRFTILDEICFPQIDLPRKLIYLQRIQFEDRRIEVRLCYYIIGKKPKMKGKWVFGQFATMLPEENFKAIVEEAEKRGWI